MGRLRAESLAAQVGMTECPFCEILRSGLPAHCLHEDERLFVLLDRDSLAFGHCMVIPKVHVEKVYDLPAELRERFFAFATGAAKRLERALAVKAVALVAFGSGLPHAHLHLVPHDEADVVMNPTRHVRHKTDDELAEDASRLAERMTLAGV